MLRKKSKTPPPKPFPCPVPECNYSADFAKNPRSALDQHCRRMHNEGLSNLEVIYPHTPNPSRSVAAGNRAQVESRSGVDLHKQVAEQLYGKEIRTTAEPARTPKLSTNDEQFAGFATQTGRTRSDQPNPVVNEYVCPLHKYRVVSYSNYSEFTGHLRYAHGVLGVDTDKGIVQTDQARGRLLADTDNCQKLLDYFKSLGIQSSTVKPDKEESGASGLRLKCPLCPFDTLFGDWFHKHMREQHGITTVYQDLRTIKYGAGVAPLPPEDARKVVEYYREAFPIVQSADSYNINYVRCQFCDPDSKVTYNLDDYRHHISGDHVMIPIGQVEQLFKDAVLGTQFEIFWHAHPLLSLPEAVDKFGVELPFNIKHYAVQPPERTEARRIILPLTCPLCPNYSFGSVPHFMRHILHAHGVREVFKVHDSLQMAYRTGAPTLSVSDATKLLKYCSEHIFCEDYAPPAKTGDSGIHDSIAATDQAGAIYRCPLCPSTFHPARTYNEFLAHMNLIHHVERVDFTGTLWSPTITMAKGYELSEDNLVKLRRFFRALRKRATFAERYGLSSNELRELLFNDKVSRVADSAGTGRIAITEDESRPRAVTPRIRLYEAAKDYVRATGQEVDMKLSWPDEDGATHTAIHHFARRKKD